MNKNISNKIDVIKKHDLTYYEGKSEKVYVGGNGAELVDTEGNKYIDMSEICGILGQGISEFNDDIIEALKGLSVDKSLANEPKMLLFEKLLSSTNNNFGKIFLASSGSEAVEWAIRIAKNQSNKHEVISFWGGLHGRTYAAASMSGIQTRKAKFGPQLTGMVFAPYPNCYKCEFNRDVNTCNYYCLDYLDRKIKAESTQDIACLIVEPFQGTSGMVFPPKGYLKKLYDWAKERDIIFILDEIQSGFGRTGKMFMYEEEGFVPDMLLLGKGLGNGFHIAALLAKDEYTNKLNQRALSGGTGGNPICCAAATSVFKQFEKLDIINNSKEVGTYLKEALNKMKDTYKIIGDVRGEGLAIGIELVANRETKEPLDKSVAYISKKALEKGVMIGGSNNVIYMRPPLTITKQQAVKVIDVLEEIIKDLNK